jgi:hypothetical protein
MPVGGLIQEMLEIDRKVERLALPAQSLVWKHPADLQISEALKGLETMAAVAVVPDA